MKICPKCTAENIDTAKFCNECGTALEVKDTESVETKPMPETKLKTVEPKDEVTPSPTAEARTDNQNLMGSHTENIEENEEPQNNNSEVSRPKKKKPIKLKKWQIVLIAILAILAILIFRPRIKKVSISYRGETTEGTVLDSNNPGFYAIGITNYGKEKEIPYTDLEIKEPKTLKADSSETVTVSYKNHPVDLTINCTTTVLKSISADYNGSEYEGTIVDKNSNIKVVATYGSGQTQELESFGVDPEITTLKNGITSKIKVFVRTDTGEIFSDELSVTGKERPFSKPGIDGEYYNCSIDQFVKYVNKKTNFTLFPMDIKVVGDDYKAFGIIPPKGAELEDGEALILAVRENEDGKLSNIVVWSTDKITGMATSMRLANIFDSSIDSDDKSALAAFVISNVYEGNEMLIYVEESNDHYNSYLMSRDFYNNNIKKQ